MEDTLERPEHARYLYTFKTQPCRELLCEDGECWNYHGFKDRRRIPQFNPSTLNFAYSTTLCTSATCSYPDCPSSHNGLEMSFHPVLYKTKLCTGRLEDGRCNVRGLHCAYAHSQAEIRTPGLMYDLDRRVKADGRSVPQEHAPVEVLPNSHLFQLHREHGALEVRLRHLSQQLQQRRASTACSLCHIQPRALVSAGCGHCICVACAQQATCPVCGVDAGWIALAVNY